MQKKCFCSAIIPAAGKGTRMGTPISKQFLKLNSKEIIVYTLEKFEQCEEIDEIIVVTGKETITYIKNLVETYHLNKVSKIVEGGKERQDSVYSGIQNVNKNVNIILVHDGVRPFVNQSDIRKTIEIAEKQGACILGVPTKDTIKICAANQDVVRTPERKTLWSIQTPQTFQKEILMCAYTKAYEDGFVGTDEAMLVERLGIPVKVVEGSYDNIKITTKEDLYVAQAFLERGGVN